MEVLRLFKYEDRERLFLLLGQAGVKANKLEELAKRYISDPENIYLGYLLYDLCFGLDREKTHSFLLLEYLPDLFEGLLEPERRAIWIRLGQLYRGLLRETPFPEWLMSHGIELYRSWCTFLIASEDRALVDVGRKLWVNQPLTEFVIRNAEKSLLSTAQMNLSAAYANIDKNGAQICLEIVC